MITTERGREWSEAEVRLLRRRWLVIGEGGVGWAYSTAAIGRELGRSKNSVVSKAHLLDLPGRGNPAKPTHLPPPAKKKRGPQPRPKKTLAVLPSVESTPAPPPPPPPRLLLSNRPCCWPIGTPKTKSFRFCEALAERGRPYCPEHNKLAFTKP